MKSIKRIFFLLIVALALLALSGCVGIPDLGPGLVLGQSYRLNSGQTLNEDLTIIGGNATLETSSTVNGNVTVIGGNVTIDGSVNGDLSVLGGYVDLNNHARIKGNLDIAGGTVNRSSGAIVEGQENGPGSTIPRITTLRTPAVNVSFDPITTPLMAIFQALALGALAVVLNLFAPHPMERAGLAARTNAAASGGIGCLTILVLVIMTITIILIPISLLGFLIAGVAALFGWLALGLLVGRRLSVWLKQSWSEPVNAGVGTLVLTLVASLLNIIPCIGWIGTAVAGLIGLGAAVLTRFGTQLYTGTSGGAAAAISPAPYTQAPPPAAEPTAGAARMYETPAAPPAASPEPPASETPPGPEEPPQV